MRGRHRNSFNPFLWGTQLETFCSSTQTCQSLLFHSSIRARSSTKAIVHIKMMVFRCQEKVGFHIKLSTFNPVYLSWVEQLPPLIITVSFNHPITNYWEVAWFMVEIRHSYQARLATIIQKLLHTSYYPILIAR